MPPIEIYISYAWRDRDADPSPDDRETLVEQFCTAAAAKNFQIRRDKTTLTYRDSIGKFMREIGAANQVVAVVSDKYLRSKYCMYEAVEVLNHRHLSARLFPVVLPDVNIYDAPAALKYVQFWEEKVAETEAALAAVKNESAKFRYAEELRDLRQIAEKIQDFMSWIADKNTLSAKIHLETRFEALLDLLGEKEVEQTENQTIAQNAAEPIFEKLDFKKYKFDHALRPVQTKTLVSKLPTALNLVGDRGQGRHRFMEDLAGCGIAEDVCLIRLNFSNYLKNYLDFLKEVGRQGGLPADSKSDFVGLVRQAACAQQKPVLLILENLHEFYEDKAEMDSRFVEFNFLAKLNVLQNCDFARPLVCSTVSMKGKIFRGVSSPFTPEVLKINDLSFDELKNEVVRRLPDLPDDLGSFVAEQLENDPRHTFDLLDSLLNWMDGKSRLSRDLIGAEIRNLRKQMG